MGISSRVKAWHGLIVAALVFAVGFGIGLSKPASAIELPSGIFGGAGGGAGAAGERVIPAGIADEAILRRLVDEARETVRQPAAALNRSGGVRALEDLANAVDTSRGVSLGPNNPARTPGNDTLPLPSFSGINAPVWVSETGPAQVVDDLILWGLTDVRVGLINNGLGIKVAAPEPKPAPAPTPTLTISLAEDTPPVGTVARGTSTFNAAKINFAASGGDVTVTRIIVTRGGSATENDIFTTCWLDGTNALACPVLNDAEAGRPTYTAIVNWTIQSGQTKTLTVQANVTDSATASRTFTLGIAAATGVTVAAGTVTGSATGNTFTITAPAPPPPSVAITLAPTTPVAANVTPGKTAHITTLVRFSAPAGTAASISAITVTRSGTAAYSTIKNLKIFDNTTGIQLGSTVISLASDSATFNLTNQWIIAAGQNRDLRIVTDVATAAILDTTFQLGIAAGGVASSTGLPVNGSLFTIVPHLSVDIAADTPGTLAGPNNAQAGTDVNVALINFYAQPGNNVVLHDVTIGLSGTGNSTDVPSIALFDGAAQVSDYRNAIVLNDGSITYPIVLNPVGQGITVSAGATKALAVRARVASNATVGHTFNARLINAAGVNATLQIYAGTPASVGGTFPVNGNNFTITAPTLTLARNPVPAAGGTLTPGNDRVLLEVDASMNTGTVRLSRLYVLPATTGNASGVISNLRLQRKRADGTWVNIALNPIISTVNGRNVYNFAIGNGNPDSDVGTAIVKLRVIANITSCIASAASIDLIVDKTTDVEVITPPSGFIVSGVPFTQVPRNMTLCPTAALTRNPASITTGQSSTLTWTTTNATSASINQNIGAVAPVASGTKQVSPTSTTTYTLTATNASGQTATSTATVTITTPAAGFTPPSRFGGAGGLEAPSVLHSPTNVLEFSDFGANSVLGPIPTAQAVTLIELVLPPVPLPVYIYDDLYVYGNGATGPEPGNLYLNGRIIPQDGTLNVVGSILASGEIRSASGVVNLGDVGGETQINGNVRIGIGGVTTLGNTTIAGTLKVGNPTELNQTLAVSGNAALKSDLEVYGNIKGRQIGSFYRLEKSIATNGKAGDYVIDASCGADDVLVSCGGDFINATFFGANMTTANNIHKCAAGGKQATAGSLTLRVQGVCFNPNRDDIPKTGGGLTVISL